VQILVSVVLVAAALAGCDGSSQPPRQPGRPSSTASQPQHPRSPDPQSPAPQAKTPAAAPAKAQPDIAGLTPAMRAVATRPAAPPTGLFLDRPQPADFRLMTYNMNRDSIFPAKDPIRAEKFQRLVKTLDPDVLALQEIRTFSADELAALLEAIAPRPTGAPWHAFRGNSTAILSKYPLTMTTAQLTPHTYRDPAIALIDLPDDRCPADLCLICNHFKCCGDFRNDSIRQRQADGVMNWLRDARAAGGDVDLPPSTAFVIAGDLNLVGGPEPLLTLLTGDVSDEAEFGPDFAPDWDDTDLTDAHPLHNALGPDDYTWRKDDSDYDPGRLDYVIYSDSVLVPLNRFVLNTVCMSDADLTTCGLERFDCCEDLRGRDLDHLPVVVDFRFRQR
jgi:endonuclease/exonuclease/phosphatase family metal-dependent hydrolase